MGVSVKQLHLPSGCRDCTVRDGSFCASTGTNTLDVLRSGSRVVAPGADLVVQGEDGGSFFVLVDGWLCLYELLEDGRRQILSFALPGDVVGFQPDEEALSFGAQAITAATICVIPRGRFMGVALEQPEMALRMLRIAARDAALAYEHLTSVGRRNAQERVAYLLLELFCRARARLPVADGNTIALPLTQSHIGDALGLTPVHTNRMLRNLRGAGIIELSQRTLRVRDPDRLAGAAGFDNKAALPWARLS